MNGAGVAQVALNAGFRGQALQTAVAVANAESGFNESAMGDVSIQDSTWGPSVGLWQIRSLKDQYGTGGIRDASRLTDPQFNANSAFQISGGGENFSPWSVYTSGSYLSFLGDASSFISHVGDATGGAVSNVSPQDQEALTKVKTVVDFAMAQVGKPYVYGGAGPDSWDCSGLVMGAYAQIGIDLPHDMAAQATYGTEVSDRTKTAAGDIVTMNGSDGYNGHGGLAISASQYVVAPHTGDVVKVVDIPWDRINNVRRLVTGGSEGLWSKLANGIGNLVGGATDMLLSPAATLAGFKDLADRLVAASKWVQNKHNIFRLIQAVGGFLLAIGGVYVVAQSLGVAPKTVPLPIPV